MTWLRRQFTGWHPAATAAATTLLLVAPVAGFIVGDATRPGPAPVVDTQTDATAQPTTTRPARQSERQPTTTDTSRADPAPQLEREVTAMPTSDSPAPDSDEPTVTTPVLQPEPTTTTVAPTTTVPPTTTTTQNCPTHTVDEDGNCVGAPDV